MNVNYASFPVVHPNENVIELVSEDLKPVLFSDFFTTVALISAIIWIPGIFIIPEFLAGLWLVLPLIGVVSALIGISSKKRRSVAILSFVVNALYCLLMLVALGAAGNS